MGQATDQEIKDALERKGHYSLNWEDLDKIELPTGVISSMYRVGDPTREESPTVFKVFYPPGCTIDKDGNIVGHNDALKGYPPGCTIDEHGNIVDKDGNIIGNVAGAALGDAAQLGAARGLDGVHDVVLHEP